MKFYILASLALAQMRPTANLNNPQLDPQEAPAPNNNNQQVQLEAAPQVSVGADQIPNDSTFCANFERRQVELSTGRQIAEGSCSSTVQGSIPTADQMPSALIVEPDNAANIPLNTAFTCTLAVINMETGFFDDPQTQYYFTPQTLNAQGVIQGHYHVTIQKLNDLTAPPNPRLLTFFRGLNDQAQQGKLSVEVPGISEAGTYRICSMDGARGHQPSLCPIAQRGSQNDCIRVNVGGAANQQQQPNNGQLDQAANNQEQVNVTDAVNAGQNGLQNRNANRGAQNNQQKRQQQQQLNRQSQQSASPVQQGSQSNGSLQKQQQQGEGNQFAGQGQRNQFGQQRARFVQGNQQQRNQNQQQNQQQNQFKGQRQGGQRFQTQQFGQEPNQVNQGFQQNGFNE